MNILLPTHVLIALSSIGFSTYLWFFPSRAKFLAGYALIGATLATGTALVVVSHSPLLSSCVAGLVYLGFVLSALASAHGRLARENVELRQRIK